MGNAFCNISLNNLEIKFHVLLNIYLKNTQARNSTHTGQKYRVKLFQVNHKK